CAGRQSNWLHFRRILIFIIPGQTQLLFTPGLCPADDVDRHRYDNPVDIRPVKIDFPLSLDGSPEPQARLLLDVVELNPEVLRADAGDGLAQEGAILFENRIDLGLVFGKLRFSPIYSPPLGTTRPPH